MTGYQFFGCVRGDIYKESFSSVNANGAQVNGIVCWGWFKGKTVRFF